MSNDPKKRKMNKARMRIAALDALLAHISSCAVSPEFDDIDGFEEVLREQKSRVKRFLEG